MNIGTLQRAKAAMVVLRGWDPNGAMNRETVAPIAAGVAIKSGQLCSLYFNVDGDSLEKWILGWDPATQPLAVPHFSKYDSDDTMITSSGLLSALSCADNYELLTPWYTGAITHGQYLIPDTVTAGSVKAAGTATAGTAGTGAPAAAVIGKATKFNGPQNMTGTISNAVAPVMMLQLQTMFQRNATV